MRINLLIRKQLHSNYSFQYSISRVKRVFIRKEVDSVVPSSNIWRRGRSYAASVASDMPEPQKDRKRISKEDRRALIESFIDKYKAINAGKFPSVTLTRKEVGGSFYVVRNILQELQNNSTILSLKSRDKKNAISVIHDVDIKNAEADSKQLEAAPDLQMSSCAKDILSTDDVKLANLVSRSILQEKDAEEVSSTSHEEPAVNSREDVDSCEFVYTESHMLKNEQETSDDAQSLKHEGGPKCEDDQVHSSLELDRKKIDQETAKDAEDQSNSKPWGRIKSIVDGIMKMWRNR